MRRVEMPDLQRIVVDHEVEMSLTAMASGDRGPE
jgi:hypothetical protein